MSANLNKKRKLADISNTKSHLETLKPHGKNLSVKNGGKPNAKITDQGRKRGASGQREKSIEKETKQAQIGKSEKTKQMKKSKSLERLMNEGSDSDGDVHIGNEMPSQVVINDLFSIYALAEKQPQRIKTVIDEIFKHKENSEEFLIQTMFLYFLELMGLAEKDQLIYMCKLISKNKEEVKLQKLFNDEEKLDVSFEKLVFFSQEKKAVLQKKLLKKVCKIFIANMIDVLPDKESYLTSIVERVCIFAQSKQRLVRYSFTYVGLYIFKFLLQQYHDLQGINQTLETNLKTLKKQKQNDTQTQSQIIAIQEAMDIIKSSYQTIQKHLLIKRSQDCTEMVRKSVFEFMQQLEQIEVKVLITKDNTEIFDMVFSALKDEDQSIRRIGLQLISHLLNKMSGDQEMQKILQVQLEKNKLQIFKMAIPTEKHQDVPTIQKSLQVIQKMVEFMPNIYNADHLQMLLNLVHYQNQNIKEEVVSLLMTISNEFDDSTGLLELQRIQPSKGNYDEITLNYLEEPNKSQKQLLKLIQMFSKHIQTRSQYIRQNQESGDDSLVYVPNMQQDQVQKILQSECEERAVLLFQSFYRKTSVIYDVQSMTNLLKRDDIDHDTQQVLANMISIALQFCNQQRNQKETQNLVFQKIWESSTSYLKLTTINELLQSYRVNFKVLEPLLRVLMIVVSYLEKESLSSESSDNLGKDLTHLLLRLINENDVSDKQPIAQQQTQAILKSCFTNLAQLQQFFPQIGRELREMALNYNDQLKRQVVPRLFQNDQEFMQGLTFIYKFNILMSQVPLSESSDSEFLKGMTSFAIANFTQMILDNHYMIEKVNKNQLTALLQVPFTFMEQLLNDSQQATDFQNLQFQTKMMSTLAEFYHDLYLKLVAHENLQSVVLQFIVETLILASGENKALHRSTLTLSINEFPQIKNLLNDLIQKIQGRIKCNETVINEKFQTLLSLFMRDFNCLLSETGVEFLINFGTLKDANIQKDIRRLYYSYKQRDRVLMESKKGIFYSFIFKCITSLFNQSPEKCMRLLEMTSQDLKKEQTSQSLDGVEISQDNFAKVHAIQVFMKTFLNSVMLLVITPKHGQSMNGLSKQQDEVAYFKLVESVIRYSLSSKNNLSLLLTLRIFFHKNFLNVKQQEALVKGLKNYYESVKPSLEVSESENSLVLKSIQQCEDKLNPQPATGTTAKKGKKDQSAVDISNANIDDSKIANNENEIEQSTDQKVIKRIEGDPEIVESLQKIGKKRGPKKQSLNDTSNDKTADKTSQKKKKVK